MSPRKSFEQRLNQLRGTLLTMADLVDQELTLALEALEKKDLELAQQVFALDEQVNALRYENERTALLLISTQQPMARDARFILASLFMNVILERMGDKAKSVAKAIPHILLRPNLTIPGELRQMAELGLLMMRDAMQAYVDEDATLALEVAGRDDEVDRLYGETFFSVLARLAKTKKPDKVEAIYELMRIARDLERFADYATDLAERVDFIVTGHLAEFNVEEWEDVRAAAEDERARQAAYRKAKGKSAPDANPTS
jgi:phosphate transport system protein